MPPPSWGDVVTGYLLNSNVAPIHHKLEPYTIAVGMLVVSSTKVRAIAQGCDMKKFHRSNTDEVTLLGRHSFIQQ